MSRGIYLFRALFSQLYFSSFWRGMYYQRTQKVPGASRVKHRKKENTPLSSDKRNRFFPSVSVMPLLSDSYQTVPFICLPLAPLITLPSPISTFILAPSLLQSLYLRWVRVTLCGTSALKVAATPSGNPTSALKQNFDRLDCSCKSTAGP